MRIAEKSALGFRPPHLSTQPFGPSFCVAVVARGRHLYTAPPGVKCMMRPLDGCLFAHVSRMLAEAIIVLYFYPVPVAMLSSGPFRPIVLGTAGLGAGSDPPLKHRPSHSFAGQIPRMLRIRCNAEPVHVGILALARAVASLRQARMSFVS